ncbi:MAG TPA: thiolase family protein [Pseudobdellovibrionaceae bacterium]|nr:thiolase family protein [Pseudobdellovibrionaceae bacterium]
MEKIVIVAATRTAVGSFLGQFSNTPAPKLGAEVIRTLLQKTQINPADVQECIMGEVLTAGVGQAPARQAALYAGLTPATACMTINKVCGSGLKAVMLAADSIQLGHSQIVIAGGQENMSLSPYILENARSGLRMGHQTLTDTMIKDGLWDPYKNFHMGNAAEICVKENHFSREEQDQFAVESYEKAQKAWAQNLFSEEITNITLESKKGPLIVNKDEEPFKTQFDKIPTLKPAFEKTGTITAANASKINDGASAMMLMSEGEARRRGLKPLASIVAQATFAQDPTYFTTAPVGAIKLALQKSNLKISDIDFWEINEAFAVVTQFAMKQLEIPKEKINVHGGAVAIGHPIGASGARILTTLIHALKTHQKRYGLATLCIGGGEAVALIVERNS